MKIYDNISLREYNTFGIDVQARRMVVVEPSDDLQQLADVCPSGSDMLIMGAGSDMLFTSNYDGTVLKLSDVSDVSDQSDQSDQSDVSDRSDRSDPSGVVLLTAWGGMTMDRLVQWTLDRGIYGLENLSAIPGSVGAAAVQNVGAYGVEAKDVIDSVKVYDLQQQRTLDLGNADCRFAYRSSMFKECPGRYLVLRVRFRLSRQYRPNLSYKTLAALPHSTAAEMRRSITAMRWQKLPRPEEHGSAGSFFKNPVVDEAAYRRLREQYPDMPEAHPAGGAYKLSAGWLIDRAGWKGRTQGRAGVWPYNALVLYNTGGCTGIEVLALADAIQADVEDKFGITLSPEAIII